MQAVDDIKPCYPLFRDDDYKTSLKNKQELFEERHSPEKVQEVFLWTTSQEYQDLNFKREALTVDPAKACQPLGLVLCALGFEKTLVYVHGSQGCVVLFPHLFQPPLQGADLLRHRRFDDRRCGGVRRPEEHASTVWKTPGRSTTPEMIAVSTTCMAEVIGDDLNAFIGNAKQGRACAAGLPGALCAHTVLCRLACHRLGQHVRRHHALSFTLNSMAGKVPGKQRQAQLRSGLRDLSGQLPCHQADDEAEMDVDCDLPLRSRGGARHARRRRPSRMYAGGTTQDESQGRARTPSPPSCCSRWRWTRRRSMSRAPGTMKCPSSTSRWAWTGPTPG
jgi:nitrogenase molybdenum-iron protein beta chain